MSPGGEPSLAPCAEHSAGGNGVHESPVVATAPENTDPFVRHYRYLLRTAPADALENAHRERVT